jgi:hypothetical protein
MSGDHQFLHRGSLMRFAAFLAVSTVALVICSRRAAGEPVGGIDDNNFENALLTSGCLQGGSEYIEERTALAVTRRVEIVIAATTGR